MACAVSDWRLRLRQGRRRQPLQLLPESAHSRRTRRLAVRRRPEEWPESFQEIAADEAFEPVPMLRSMQTRGGADQPVVFVVARNHGLAAEYRRRERLAAIPCPARRAGSATSPSSAPDVDRSPWSAAATGSCASILQQSHAVIPFAYDWRRIGRPTPHSCWPSRSRTRCGGPSNRCASWLTAWAGWWCAR